jgi:myo-inositol-1-phosphate synthase
MQLQFTWQGCDSVLAAPLVIDLARLLLLAQRRGDVGALPAAACFFKRPIGHTQYDLNNQFDDLLKYIVQ